MGATLIQDNQVIGTNDLSLMGNKRPLDEIFRNINTEIDFPLRMYASSPFDSKLNFSPLIIVGDDGLRKTLASNDIIPEIVTPSWIDFVDQSTSGGVSFDITFPVTNTLNYFRRVGFSYLKDTQVISAVFSDEVSGVDLLASVSGLMSVSGISLGLLDVECINVSGAFQTIDSVSGFVENGGIVNFVNSSYVDQGGEDAEVYEASFLDGQTNTQTGLSLNSYPMSFSMACTAIRDSLAGDAISFTNEASGDDSAKFDNFLNVVVKQADGKVLAGGAFASYGGVSGRNYLVRFNADGTLDTDFCTNAVDGAKFGNHVRGCYVQPDGKILVGGIFTNYAGTSGRSYLIRLNSDGTLDTSFCTNAVDSAKFSSYVKPICVQQDGKILLGGFFSNYAGTTDRNRLIRLNSDGTLDTSFCTNAVDSAKFSSTVHFIKCQSDGKILVGGDFLSYAGTTDRNRLIRLNSDGTLDTSFCTNAVDGDAFASTVYCIAVHTNGKILVGGNFTSYAGTSGRDRLVRLNSDGTLDTDFCTNAVDGSKFGGIVYSVAIQSNDSLVVGGAFTDYNANTGIDYLVRLSSLGVVDSGFIKLSNDTVYWTLDIDGTIYVGGKFSSIALTNDGNAERRSFFVAYSESNADDVIFETKLYNVLRQVDYLNQLESFDLSLVSRVGDDCGVDYSVDVSGNILYTSTDMSDDYSSNNVLRIRVTEDSIVPMQTYSDTLDIVSGIEVSALDTSFGKIHILDGVSAQVPVYLPKGDSTLLNNTYAFKCLNYDNAVTLFGVSGDTIDGVSAFNFHGKYYIEVKLISDSEWIVIS